jgi:hypothetical protein
LAILSKSASSPICNLSGWFAESLFAAVSWCTTGIQQNLPGLSATFIPHGWWATFIKLAWLALFERTFCETLCQKLDICWKPLCEICRLELAFEKHAESSFWKEKIQQHSEPPFWRRNLLLSNDP